MFRGIIERRMECRFPRVAALLVLFTLSAAPQFKESKPEPYLEKEAYEVYAALLPEEWIWKYAKAERLVIQLETSSSFGHTQDGLCVKLKEEARGDWQPVVDDYIKMNRTSKKLIRGLPIDRPYHLVPSGEIRGIFKDQLNWREFYAKYPRSGGYLWFSAVGFNADKSRALVQINHSCGGLCGGGAFHFLEKKDGKWVRAEVAASSCLWVS